VKSETGETEKNQENEFDLGSTSGLPDFSCYKIPKREKYSK
jgi:hypothetical protein